MKLNQAQRERALKAAREAYLAAAKRSLGPDDMVRSTINAYNKAARAQQLTIIAPPSDLLNRMPAHVRTLVRRTAAETGLTVELIMTKSTAAPPGMRQTLAAVRADMWVKLRGHRDNRGKQPSFPLIGYWFDVDHSTVCYGVKRTTTGARDYIKRERKLAPVPANKAAEILNKQRAARRRRYRERKNTTPATG